MPCKDCVVSKHKFIHLRIWVGPNLIPTNRLVEGGMPPNYKLLFRLYLIQYETLDRSFYVLAMTLLDKVKLVFLHLIGTVVENKVTRRWAFRQSRQTYIVSSIYCHIVYSKTFQMIGIEDFNTKFIFTVKKTCRYLFNP